MAKVPGPLFSRALSRFRSEVKREDDCVLDVTSAQELLRQTKAIESQESTRTKRSKPSIRLEAILPHLNDFAAVIAICGGADPKTTGLIWGSLKVIWTLAYPAGDVLDDILTMLDELSWSLPRFRAYEETLPMNKALESALLDVYTEMICFCARTIGFLRSTTHRPLIRLGWSKLNEDFAQTSKRLKSLSRIVDSEAEAIRLRIDEKGNVELLGAMEIMKNNHTNNERLPCHFVPFGIDEQFFGRGDILQKMKDVLDPVEEGSKRKYLVLHGLGGVGKTRIALQYVNQSRDRFDAILWISADNSIKLTQSFLEASRRLGMTPENSDSQDAVAAMSKVKGWLMKTRCHWLLVFDNADNTELLVGAWPGDAAGSILVTSRDFTVGYGTSAKDCKVQPFDGETGVSAFLSLVGHDPKSEVNRASAAKIVKFLGGLPLAINQISGFIVQQKLTLEDFLPLYARHSEKIHTRKLVPGNYEHTLSTVWELALGQLSGPSRTLQILLSFFDPDKVHESVLREGGEQVDDEDFAFLGDEMDFLEAKEALLKAGLLDRSSEDATLAVHRLVQAAVMKRLSPPERLRYFNRVVKLLSSGFPNTWNTVTSHQFSSWAKCERCLPHVNFLIVQSNRYKLIPTNPAEFTELILRCCWHVTLLRQIPTGSSLNLFTRYLYEREHYNQARQFMQITLQFLNHDTLMFASASMLQGLIELDTNNVQKALGLFLVALEIRQREPAEDAFIASSLNAISLAYTELGDLVKAVEMGQKAIDIRLRSHSDRIGNSYSNMASTLLRMGKPHEAEEMLKRCPSLKKFTDETFLNTNNPRFSGDMVLLSRIRQQQGKLDDALRLSSKALAFRQQLLGSRLKTCDSLYQVASLLQLRGDLSSAINLLEESVSIAENIPEEAGGYQARAYFKLAQIYEALNEVERVRVCQEAAESIRRRISGDAFTPSDASQEAYDKLVLWMLW